jgi:hypothetical protein
MGAKNWRNENANVKRSQQRNDEHKTRGLVELGHGDVTCSAANNLALRSSLKFSSILPMSSAWSEAGRHSKPEKPKLQLHTAMKPLSGLAGMHLANASV